MAEVYTGNNYAPLENVGLATTALDRAIQRERHLPGLVVFYGKSGFGKTFAGNFAANKHRAYYVQYRSNWTKKFFLLSILKDMGIVPARTTPEMADQIAEELALSRRPLIVDEADELVERGGIKIVLDLYESSRAAILLIGEELLPKKLAKWEKVHGRVLEWVPAQPVGYDDALHLAKLYANKVEIAPDLLEKLVKIAKGSARRIVVNLSLIQNEAHELGVTSAGLDWWGDREFYTGEEKRRGS